MTIEIGVVFAILGTAMLLFITDWIRADIVAVLVLVSLAAIGVLEVEEVLKGFSSEAVNLDHRLVDIERRVGTQRGGPLDRRASERHRRREPQTVELDKHPVPGVL
jgi:hypothetical protein